MLNPIKTTDFEAIKLKLASPEDILSWSHGEVLKPETINYRTQKPEKDGLFCERIFGPSKDWECYCGKYKKIRYKGIVCDKCGVEVTRSIVRRIRMGHIRLQSPVSHIWFLRGLSSKLGIVLDLSMQSLEKVIYFASFVITDVNEPLKNDTLAQIKEEYKSKKALIENDFKKQSNEAKSKKGRLMEEKNNEDAVMAILSKEVEKLEKIKEEKITELSQAFDRAIKELKDLKSMAIISENAYQDLSLKYGHIFEAGIGADAVRKLLEKIDLGKTIKILEEDLIGAVESKKERITKRLKLFKSFHHNGIRPEWMIMTVIPVIPPDLRPMVALDGGRFATSDLNDLYRRVINRNNRLKQLLDLNAPEVICRNEKRMLQEAVDALIDNSARHTKTVTASTGQKRNLKSLADSLKGKQGRFRQNLLGKRVDYSGRSVIVVNPKLRLYECGLPKVMALELFKPFVISKLIEQGLVHNVRSASRYIEAGHNEVWDILEEITHKSYVLLNRAPTLHRLGIQAFRPILIEGKAIQIHPLVCSAFNADFDGDQMAVHVPLTEEAIREAGEIMLSSHNLLKPATGDPIVAPSQDMIWGAFYLTNIDEPALKKGEEKKWKYYSSSQEAKLAHELGAEKLSRMIRVKMGKELVETTIGRIIFNEVLPEKLQFVNEVADKGMLKKLIKKSLLHYSEDETVDFLDNLKTKSFEYITKSGLSWGIGDLPALPERDILVSNAEVQVDLIQEQYEEGLLTDSERYSKIIELWTGVKDRVTEICKVSLPKDGPIYSMIESGARGSWAQLTQILGMKGLVTSPSGDIIELPVKGNFKRGFEVLEYFISTHGVRKGLSDTALRTANAGYLTRRLIDVAQDVIITKEDCGDSEGILLTRPESEEMNTTLVKRLIGRALAVDLKNAKGKILIKATEIVTEKMAESIAKETLEEARVRSVLSCKLNRGVCAQCYGYDLGYNRLVSQGTAVGIIAAQSIGEPGTQLTMRTFHTGGVAGLEDITQGLPRVEEIFEARPPKRKAYMADVSGRAEIETAERVIEDEKGKMVVTNPQVKVLKIYYQGTESQKYFFAEAAKEKAAEEKAGRAALKKAGAPPVKSGDAEAKAKAKKIKIAVEEGQEIKAGQLLFTVGEKEIRAEAAGIIEIDKKCVKVKVNAEKVKEFLIPKGFSIWVKTGDQVKKGDQLTEGALDLQQLYRLRGKYETQKNIIKEIQFVYSSQGQPLNEKHIEIIAKQMFSRIYVQDAGDTDLLSGEIVEKAVFERANIEAKAKKSRESGGDVLLLGITKSSLTTNSFLSAASFQNTSSVLIDAAINGKVDYLEGLKENVIIGRLIPSGTGFNPDKKYRYI